ncbi:MAG: MoxR family ATPase [Candidatus Nanoarchaeia archaeon]|nr:MoxR family ATPase [Candidatus Nanoarchaeia archaeon]
MKNQDNKENQEIKEISNQMQELKNEISKILVGNDDVVKWSILAVASGGNVLLEGVPGLGKTLFVNSFAKACDLKFSRIQFTPDLLPTDVIGTKIFNMKDSTFQTKKGPIFSNVILADEINRAPPKTQSSLLEAMQEKQVTIGEETYLLDKPFFVMATQNPIEQEGTYNLPEAQVDRFMFKIIVNYPSLEEEKEIMNRISTNYQYEIKKVVKKDFFEKTQKIIKDVFLDEEIQDYILEIVNKLREKNDYIEVGPSPRATIYLSIGAKANAVFDGRDYVTPDDVKEIAYNVLRHRIILSYEAMAKDVTSELVIKEAIDSIEVA